MRARRCDYRVTPELGDREPPGAERGADAQGRSTERASELAPFTNFTSVMGLLGFVL